MDKVLVLPSEIQEVALRVPEKKQKEVLKVLNDIFNGTDEWEKKVDAIEVKDIKDIMSIDLADTARLNAKKARLNGEKIFDAKRSDVQLQMADFKLEDALWLKSKQIMQLKFKHIEEKAKYKADFAIRYEKEQHELKVEKRITQMFPFNPEIQREEIELLTDETFDILLNGLIKAQEEKQAAEAKAEKDRIEAEKVELKRIADIEKENKRLEKEAKEKERLAKIERQKLAKEKAEKQKLADELEAARVKEIKAKQAEEKAKQIEKEEAYKLVQSELNKGDSDKVKDLIAHLEEIKTEYTFKSKVNQQMYADVCGLIDKVINHINK